MIVGSMATYPARRHQFWESVRTIVNQVDLLYVVLNEYSDVPEVPSVPSNVEFIIPDRDLKDLGKFVPKFGDSDFVFLTDDDITYPDDYVTRTLSLIESFSSEARCVFGYHGTRYLPASFDGTLHSTLCMLRHRLHGGKIRKLRKSFFYENHLATAQVVDQLGTGVAAMRGRDLAPFEFMDGSQQFVDVRMALWCQRNDITRVCLPRSAGWLNTLSTEDSIYKSFTRRTPRHVRKEIYEFAGKWERAAPPKQIADSI